MDAAVTYGASFSHFHLKERGIPLNAAWTAYRELGLPWVRLGCYWDEIEETRGKYHFNTMHRLLEECTKQKLDVVMTVGVKAPRWPEYYFPQWFNGKSSWRKNHSIGASAETENALFSYIGKAVHELKNHSCIRYWQVENEPLDPSGPENYRIALPLLSREVTLVRSLDGRPVVISLWGNELKRRGNLETAAQLADVVGLDLYPRVPAFSLMGHVHYRGVEDSDKYLRNKIDALTKQKKTVWISELQAELWGKPDSCTPKHIEENARWALRLGAGGIFLWGFEYWLHERRKGNNSYWEAARKAIDLIGRKR